MVVLVLELLLEEHNVHGAVQRRDEGHEEDLGHVRQLRYHRGGDEDEHGEAAEVGREKAAVRGQWRRLEQRLVARIVVALQG